MPKEKIRTTSKDCIFIDPPWSDPKTTPRDISKEIKAFRDDKRSSVFFIQRIISLGKSTSI